MRLLQRLLPTLLATLTLTPAQADIEADIGAWVPFQLGEHGMVLDVELDGHRATALVDFAFGIDGVSQQFIDSHYDGFRYFRTTAVSDVSRDATLEVPVVRKFRFELGGERRELTDVAVLPAQMMGGHDVRLGATLLSDGVMQLDFPNHRLRYIQRRVAGLPHYQNIDMQRVVSASRPTFAVDIPDDARLWMDVGNVDGGEVYVARAVAEQRGWLSELTTRVVEVNDAGGGKVQRVAFRVPALQLGPFLIEDVPVVTAMADGEGEFEHAFPAAARADEVPAAMTSSDGVIGYALLRHFVLTLDYEEGRAHLQAN